MKTTLGMYQHRKPPFEPRAQFIAARNLKWPDENGNSIEILRATPIDLLALKCDEKLAAKLYRTGHFGMVLNDDGTPRLKAQASEEEAKPINPEPAPEPEPEFVGATCPKCGKQFKSRHVPHFHTIHCGKQAE